MAVIDQKITDMYAIYNADFCEVSPTLKENSIHLSCYSPPFAGLYHYSSDERDLSNCSSYQEFLDHYFFVIKELYRITMHGRITAVHCADIPSGNSGQDYLTDLPGDIIKLHNKAGFDFIARHTIWKEPLMVRNRTMAKVLAHKTIVDDSAYGGVASADYLIVFRKKGKNKIPISHPTGFDYYAGGTSIPKNIQQYKNFKGDQKQNLYSHWIWRRYASSIWDDIDIANVLPYQESKDENDEKHVHPLQLDVIDRCIIMRSNPGEIVLTPFMGVGSEVYSALKNGRKAIGVELKESYYNQTLKNIENIIYKPESTLNLFSLYEIETNAA